MVQGSGAMSVHPAGTLKLPASVVTIGAFDGVHRGHQALIRRAKDRAARLSVPAVVYTFDPPPRAYFRDTLILTPLAEKLRRLEELGVDHAVVASFDAEYAARGAQAFLDELEGLSPREVWVGRNFRFGGDREGGLEDLEARFSTRVLEPVRSGSGEVISSSQVRALITQGAMVEARALLGWRRKGGGIEGTWRSEIGPR